MKSFLLFTLIISSSSWAQLVPIELKLSDVSKKVSEQNFQVLEKAQRVYQSKERIKVARAALLPKLKIWNILKIPFDPTAIIDVVRDIAPFTVPSNWFKFKQTKLMALVEGEQYRSLWANELMTAKLLYMTVLKDKALLEHIVHQIDSMEEIYKIMKTRELLGGLDPTVSNMIKVRIIALKEDKRDLGNLIYEEKKEILYMLGIDNQQDLILSNISMPSVPDLEELRFDQFIFRALSTSPELSQYDYLYDVLGSIKNEINFSILGTSSLGLGSSGNVFDNIPIEEGLGFGRGARVRIAASEKNVLKIKETATREYVKKSLNFLIRNYNSDLVAYESLMEMKKITEDNFSILQTKLLLGQPIDAFDILEILKNRTDAEVRLVDLNYDILFETEKLSRITFTGDYTKKAAGIEEVLNELKN